MLPKRPESRPFVPQSRAWGRAGEFGKGPHTRIGGPRQRVRGSLAEVLFGAQGGLESLAVFVEEAVFVRIGGAGVQQAWAENSRNLTLAIDDLGTGQSNLSYLKQFPIHRLKIDQSFVDGIPADKENGAITQAIISMGRSLGLKVIAEGIETREQPF